MSTRNKDSPLTRALATVNSPPANANCAAAGGSSDNTVRLEAEAPTSVSDCARTLCEATHAIIWAKAHRNTTFARFMRHPFGETSETEIQIRCIRVPMMVFAPEARMKQPWVAPIRGDPGVKRSLDVLDASAPDLQSENSDRFM